MEKKLTISGIDVRLKSSGALPRLYTTLIHRDIFKDMVMLESVSVDNAMSNDVMTTLENIAYVMYRHANPKDAKSIDEWLEQFGMFGIVQALPEILEMWTSEISTTSVAKKNNEQ